MPVKFDTPPGFKFPGTPPKEALAFFRSKGLAVGFDYRDVWRQEHAVAFTVAKAMNVELLETIRGSLGEALAKGQTFEQWQKNLRPELERLGWWGRKDVIDPKTGELVSAQLGSPRRLKTIYRANLRTARAAGQWERAERTKKALPYLVYLLGPSKEHRPEHREWHGTVLPVDDEWWTTHMPPNGWGCKCRTRQVSAAEYGRLQERGISEPASEETAVRDEQGNLTGHHVQKREPVKTEAPPIRTKEWVNKRTGQVEKVPVGIDPGWDTNPGRARLAAFTPPPRGGLPESFPAGVALPPLPAPRKLPGSVLAPAGEAPEKYVEKFLGEFGVKRGEEKIFVDAAGMPVTISEELFRDASGSLKVLKRGRAQVVALLAQAIKDPDEIWWRWEKSRTPEGGWLLRRRYLARFDVEGKRPALAVFEHGQDGWNGVTAFGPESEANLERQRGGTLAYRRKPTEK